MSKILVIEDDQAIREMITFTLQHEGHDIDVADSAFKAEKILPEFQPDLILLDWMLPDQSGIDFLRALKKGDQKYSIPVIMLTAKSTNEEKVEGLDAGADDYITKPFSPIELLARIRSVLRRSTDSSGDKSIIEYSGLQLNVNDHSIIDIDSSSQLQLTSTEFRLLEFFITHPRNIYSRQSLLDHVWGQEVYVEERSVDVYITRVRKILKKVGKDHLLETVRSLGYRFQSK